MSGKESDQAAQPDLRLAEVIATLSLAVDLGVGADMEDSLKVCVVATRLADSLGLAGDDLRLVYYLSLIRLAGCTSESHRLADVSGDELRFGRESAGMGSPTSTEMLRFMWAFAGGGRSLPGRVRSFSRFLAKAPALAGATTVHCEVAVMLAARLGLGEDVRDSIWSFFERWDGKGRPKGRSGEDIPLHVRIVQVAQQTVVLHSGLGRETVFEELELQAGRQFDPSLIAHVQRNSEVTDGLEEADSPWDLALALEPEPHRIVEPDRIDEAFAAIGDFADLKSLYTAGNAAAVSELATAAAARCNVGGADVATLRRAAFVKDVGRVGVTTAIWDKAGILTRPEWERVRLHPYLSERVLSRAGSLEPIGRLASLHHESLDGRGYHRGASAAELTLPARLLQAADRYHAMTSRRPWRPPLPPAEAGEQLQREVEAGLLDPTAVAAVLEAAGHSVGRRRQHVAGLTERELEVLDLVASGYTTKEIAARLVIARKTADHHIQNIYAKLDVSTRPAATLFAMQHGLVGRTRMG